jgi:hypothetical protein
MLLNLILAHRDDRFQVAVNENMDQAQAHGTAKVPDESGFVRTIPFQVDHPNRIKNPTPEQVMKLFQQFDQLGYRPVTVIVGRGSAQRAFRRSTHYSA